MWAFCRCSFILCRIIRLSVGDDIHNITPSHKDKWFVSTWSVDSNRLYNNNSKHKTAVRFWQFSLFWNAMKFFFITFDIFSLALIIISRICHFHYQTVILLDTFVWIVAKNRWSVPHEIYFLIFLRIRMNKSLYWALIKQAILFCCQS